MNTITEKKDTTQKFFAYCYLFNYFGGDKIDNKEIRGANITVAIIPIKDGKEVKFLDDSKEPMITEISLSRICDLPIKRDFYLSDIVSVRFNRTTLYNLTINAYAKNKFLQHFQWDDIKIEVVEKSLDYLKTPYCQAEMTVSEDVWDNFLKNRLDDFDIRDNVNAQCLAYCMV